MIKKIKWRDHDILGNLELDFTKSDGSIYNTIVIAGENGTGKTTILETLAAFLNLESIEPFDYINYVANGSEYTIINDDSGAKYGFHSRKKVGESNSIIINTNSNNNRNILENDLEDLRYYGFAYSKARSGFNTKKVVSTTTSQLDSNKYEIDSNDDFTSIKQLIVDIDAQDNSEWMELTKSGLTNTFKDFEKKSRLYRFENAFNSFFTNIKFKGIDYKNKDEKDILFEKHNRKISIDKMSTGEKQIVFRGAYLLKNSKGIASGIVLIDEPELSMHPQWQKKIIGYYKNLFMKDGVQSVQMIFATHSEYVLQSVLEDKDNSIIITLNDINGKIEARKISSPKVLPSITLAETNYIAFGVISTDYHIQLYGYLQNKTGTTSSVKRCDDYIASQNSLYNPTIHTKISTHGNTTYQTLPTYIRNAIDHPSSANNYTYEELKCSIELLIELCK